MSDKSLSNLTYNDVDTDKNSNNTKSLKLLQ